MVQPHRGHEKPTRIFLDLDPYLEVNPPFIELLEENSALGVETLRCR